MPIDHPKHSELIPRSNFEAPDLSSHPFIHIRVRPLPKFSKIWRPIKFFFGAFRFFRSAKRAYQLYICKFRGKSIYFLFYFSSVFPASKSEIKERDNFDSFDLTKGNLIAIGSKATKKTTKKGDVARKGRCGRSIKWRPLRLPYQQRLKEHSNSAKFFSPIWGQIFT